MDSTQQITTQISKSINFTGYDVKWVPNSARLVSAGGNPRGTGCLKIWELNKAELKLVHEVLLGDG